MAHSVLLTTETLPLKNERSIKQQWTIHQLIDRVPSNPVYYSMILNIVFGLYLVHANVIDQGCRLPNGLKVPNGWERLYNNCQEKCVCRRNKFQCSPTGCDLNYNECTVDSFGESYCHGALLVVYNGAVSNAPYARRINLNGFIRFGYSFINFTKGTLNENLNDMDFRFSEWSRKYGRYSSVYNGCGATLMGQLWYFGGRGEKREV